MFKKLPPRAAQEVTDTVHFQEEEKQMVSEEKTLPSLGLFHPLSHCNLLCPIKLFTFPEPSKMKF
jgi:hypothetical protein